MVWGAPSRPVIKARRLLFVMPVTAHSMLARAPARAMTRGSPNRSPGALRPSPVRVGCDIRAKAGLSKTHPWPTLSVCSRRVLTARARACSSGRLWRRRWQPRSSGEFTTVSTRRARPSFRYCFTREWRQNALIVTPSQRRSIAVLNTPPAWPLGLRPRGERLNSTSTFSGRPRSRLSAMSASKNARACRGASNTRVRDTSTCRSDSSHQYPAARSSAVKGSGSRDIHRSKNAWMSPGPSRSQISCRPSGSSQQANPLDSSVKPIPARAGIGFTELSNGFACCDDPDGLQLICDRLGPGDIQAFFDRWMSRLPLPLTAEDRAAGYWWELSLRQVEVSRTLVFDAPRQARAFFEALIADNLDLGRPENVEVLFKRDPRGRKPKDQGAGGAFKTAIDRRCDGVTINAFWRHSRVKQYLKDGRALRIETVVNSPDDLGCQRRIHNLPELQARARAVNTRLLHTEKAGQGCVFDSPAFARISQPTLTGDGRG